MAKLTPDDLLHAINEVDDDLIAEAEPGSFRKSGVNGLTVTENSESDNGGVKKPGQSETEKSKNNQNTESPIVIGKKDSSENGTKEEFSASKIVRAWRGPAAAAIALCLCGTGLIYSWTSGSSGSSETAASAGDGLVGYVLETDENENYDGEAIEDGTMETSEGTKSGNDSILDTLTNLITPIHAYAVSQKEYPEMAKMPNLEDYMNEKGELTDEKYEEYSAAYEAWLEDYQKRLTGSEEDSSYLESLGKFLTATSSAVMTSGKADQNVVYSPANVYVALAMLSEVTDGETREQILSLLNVSDTEELETKTQELWNANYVDDGSVTSLLADSVWMSDQLNYREDTLEKLSDLYYASSFSGDVTDEAYTEDMQNWINKHTGNLLTEQAEGEHFTEDTVLDLISTIYYKAAWAASFSEADNTEKVFKNADGSEEECTFMNSSGNQNYYSGKNFNAVSESLENSGCMWLILPDEGTSPEDLLADEDCLKLIQSNGNYDAGSETGTAIEGTSVSVKEMNVNLSVPKFDVASELHLEGVLQNLGIIDVFDYDLSDFSPLLDPAENIPVAVTSVNHAARVKIDEDGVEAAAFTSIMMETACEPEELEQVDLVLDRPFLFAITGNDGAVLFMGIVNTMSE